MKTLTQKLSEMVEDGFTLSEICAESGVSRAKVYRHLKKTGVSYFKPTDMDLISPVDFRGNVADMKPHDAVDYLLGILDMIFNPSDDFEWIRKAGIKSTPTRMRMLNFMRLREGRLVTKEDLYGVVCSDRSTEEWPEQQIVTVYISLIRKDIEKTNWSISTVWGQGFIFRCPA